jgi:M6 family metalloprotease-like protein
MTRVRGVLLLALVGILMRHDNVQVNAVSPNQADSYPAISYLTNDGGQEYTRQVNNVRAKFAVHSNEDDPTEELVDNGYTIVFNKASAKYEYAVLDETTGDLVGSGVAVIKGMVPAAGQFRKHVRRTAAGRALVAKTPSETTATPTRRILTDASRRLSHIAEYETWNSQVEDLHRHRSLQEAVTSLKTTLVIPLQFADHNDTSRWLPTQQELTALFNNDGPNATVAPSGSVKDVFRTLSHGKLDLAADVMDWIPLSQPESFYAAGKRGYNATYLHQALREALDYLETSVKLDFSQYDVNQDGLIDSILFVHSGYAAEFGGISEDGAYFMDRIWSHTWNLQGSSNGWTSATSGVKVHNYPMVSAIYGTHPTGKSVTNTMVRVGVVAHELSQFLGLDANSCALRDNTVGSWGLMSNAWGFSADQNCVPLLNPYSLIELGWATTQDITRADSSSQLTLKPAPAADAITYKISEGFAHDEYLLLEFRHRGDTVESCLPVNGGLAVWHIVESAATTASGGHCHVALIQADGQMDLEHAANPGDSSDLFHPLGVSSLGPGRSSVAEGQAVPYPNTDSYQGYSTGLILAEIGMPHLRVDVNSTTEDQISPSLTFQVLFEDATAAPTTASPSISPAPTKSPTVSPTRVPTGAPTPYPTSDGEGELNTFAPTSSMAPTEGVSESCSGREGLFLLELTTDLKGSETTWELTDALHGPVVMKSGGPYPDGVSRNVTYDACLDRFSCWSLTLKDSAQNGIDLSPLSADYGNATPGYKVWWQGVLQDESKIRTNGTSPSFSGTGVDFGEKCRVSYVRNVHILNQKGDFSTHAMMFDVVSKQSTMLMRFIRFHLKLALGDVTFRVYTKNGSYQGYETTSDAWTLIKTQTVTPKGIMIWTQAENWDVFLPLMKGTTQALYIEFDQPVLYATDCTLKQGIDGPGQIWRRYDDIDVLSGVASFPGFGGIDTSSTQSACMEGKMGTSTVDILSALFTPTATPSASPSGIMPSASPSISDLPSLSPTRDPTYSPTTSSAPTSGVPDTCAEGEKLFVFELNTDMQGSDTTWELVDALGGLEVKASGGNFRNDLFKSYRHGWCLQESSCWKLTLRDSAGNGIQGVDAGNGYKMSWDGQMLDESRLLPDGSSPTFYYVGADFGIGCVQNTLRYNRDMEGINEASVTSSGIMFDVKATRADSFVIRFAALVLDASSTGLPANMKIYTKDGTYQGFETSAQDWTLVSDQPVLSSSTSGGYSGSSNLDEFVPIMAQTTQAFYIELDQPILMTIPGADQNITHAGQVYKSFDELDMCSGVSSSAEFGGVKQSSVALLPGKIMLSSMDVLDFPSSSPSAGPTGVSTSTPSANATSAPFAAPTITMPPSANPTRDPTYSPTVSFAPTRAVPEAGECREGTKLFVFELNTDLYGADTTWELVDALRGPEVKASGGNFRNELSTFYRHGWCLQDSSCWKLTLRSWDGEMLDESRLLPDGSSPTFHSVGGADFGSGCVQNTLRFNVTSSGIMFDVNRLLMPTVLLSDLLLWFWMLPVQVNL